MAKIATWELSEADVNTYRAVAVVYGGRTLFSVPLTELRTVKAPSDPSEPPAEDSEDVPAVPTVRRVKGGHWHCSACGRLDTVTSESGARIHVGRKHKIGG